MKYLVLVLAIVLAGCTHTKNEEAIKRKAMRDNYLIFSGALPNGELK